MTNDYRPIAPHTLESMIDRAVAHPQMPRRPGLLRAAPVWAPAALAACLLLVFVLTPGAAPSPAFDAQMDDFATAIMLDMA